MVTPVEWLEAQKEEIGKELEHAQHQFDQVQNRLREAQKRYEACDAMLSIARADQTAMGIGGEASKEQASVKPQMTMVEQMEEILKQRGPMNKHGICAILKKQGRPNTSTGSVVTILSKHRPERFNHNSEGLWYIVEK